LLAISEVHMTTTTPVKHIDYTEMDHHQDIPDSRDTGDISRPQGEFWHRNERPGADEIKNVQLEPATDQLKGD
jgi:hypothetical protein